MKNIYTLLLQAQPMQAYLILQPTPCINLYIDSFRNSTYIHIILPLHIHKYVMAAGYRYSRTLLGVKGLGPHPDVTVYTCPVTQGPSQCPLVLMATSIEAPALSCVIWNGENRNKTYSKGWKHKNGQEKRLTVYVHKMSGDATRAVQWSMLYEVLNCIYIK